MESRKLNLQDCFFNCMYDQFFMYQNCSTKTFHNLTIRTKRKKPDLLSKLLFPEGIKFHNAKCYHLNQGSLHYTNKPRIIQEKWK